MKNETINEAISYAIGLGDRGADPSEYAADFMLVVDVDTTTYDATNWVD
jgi:hypothetical protein